MLRGLVLASDSDGSPAACVENIDSRMGLEPLNEGLRLHDCLCVEKEGRDTPAMAARTHSTLQPPFLLLLYLPLLL